MIYWGFGSFWDDSGRFYIEGVKNRPKTGLRVNFVDWGMGRGKIVKYGTVSKSGVSGC